LIGSKLMIAPVSDASLRKIFLLKPIMKASSKKPVPAESSPVFPQTMHHLRSNEQDTALSQKAPKRANVKSRDTREDRGTRQAKNTHSSQSFPHGR
jgi:hypothetical protein